MAFKILQRILCGLFVVLLVAAGSFDCGAMAEDVVDLSEMSLEELMNIEVTSVSRKAEKISEAAAAVFVITEEDIRRSGATTIPDLLRMVPGLQVAQISKSEWAISSRGFNDRFSNKLLVLMDGRTLYTPLFSGVFWDVQDTMLEDIDRIEVIRGPGATLWGANAVNGVINIITKHSKDTQGGLVTTGGGTEDRLFGSARYGGTNGKGMNYRLYTKYFDRDESVVPSGSSAGDDRDMGRAGFRIDWEEFVHDSFTLQGDMYNGDFGATVLEPIPSSPYVKETDTDGDATGANMLGRWERSLSSGSDMFVQLYYDWYQRDQKNLYKEDRHTIDVDFHHLFGWGNRHELVWGLGYRFTHDDIDNSDIIQMDPDSEGDHLFSGFIQDEITLKEDEWRLTLGSKIEHNDYTGYEIQPNARVLFTPNGSHTLWVAISRAVRTPSRAENDVIMRFTGFGPNESPNPTPFPAIAIGKGDRDFDSEEMLAYEIGYRLRASHRLTLDFAGFYNDYDNLITGEIGRISASASPPPLHLLVDMVADNKMYGETYGFEGVADFRPFDWWHLQLAYTYLQMQLHLDNDSTDLWFETAEGDSPHNQASLRSMMDLPCGVECDLWFRYVESLSNQGVPSYLVMDARLGWKATKKVELSLVGRNLFDNQHPEFKEPNYIHSAPTEVEHSVYGKITVRF